MMHEVDEQLGGVSADLVIAPVGVGSFAQAVVSHYKSPGRGSSKVATVEADTSACLYKSLKGGSPDPLPFTVPTIMAGLNCGTVSSFVTGWTAARLSVTSSHTKPVRFSRPRALWLALVERRLWLHCDA